MAVRLSFKRVPPVDDRTAQTIQTYDAIAESYARRHGSVDEIRALLAAFRRHLDGGRILDVGCGPGRDVEYFSTFGHEAIGVDLSQGQLAQARARVPAARFCLMDMRHLAFADGQFDALWACASLLHLPRRDAGPALAGFRRVVRRGGLVYVGVKAGQGEKEVPSPDGVGRTRLFTYYARPELEALLLDADLTPVETIVEQAGETTWLNVFTRVA